MNKTGIQALVGAQKHPLPQTPKIKAIKADAADHARRELKPENAYGFELLIDELLTYEYVKSGEIKPNHRCKLCFGKGRVEKILEPGKPKIKGIAQKTATHPCQCVLKTYYQRKPKDEVILPAAEYGKPLEPPIEVPKEKAKAPRKRTVPSGSKSPKTEPGKAKPVRKNKSSISDKAKD